MVHEIIKNRKSIRKYSVGGTVTDGQIKDLLEAACLAPSACNRRPWEFIVVTDREKLKAAEKLHPYAQMLKTAQCAIVVVGLPETQKGGIADGMWVQDCAAATENILLQAAALGLGTCWCGVYPTGQVKVFQEFFALPVEKVPLNLIAVGVPDEKFGSRGFYEESKVTWIR
jgi:nitroreductase